MTQAVFGFLGAGQIQILLSESGLLLLLGFLRHGGGCRGYLICVGSAFAVKDAIGILQLGHGILAVHGNGFPGLDHWRLKRSVGVVLKIAKNVRLHREV